MPTAELKSMPLPVACFAPDLTDEALTRYQQLIAGVPAGTELRDSLDTLYKCVAAWWELPESKQSPDHERLAIVHRGKQVAVPLTPLEEQHVKALWDVTPWMRELTAMEPLFDTLEGDIRNCAFHLLWYAKEISLDREPLHQSKLPA